MIDLQQLATARDSLTYWRKSLRDAENALPVERARAELRAIEEGRANGSNDTDRKRALLLALEDDTDYQHALSFTRRAQREVDELSTQITILEDQRRAAEWEIRSRLADAMLAAQSTPIQLTNPERAALADADR